MAKVQLPTRGDWRLEDAEGGSRVVIPTRPLWPLVVFLGLWLFAWTAGEASALNTLFRPGPWLSKGFTALWLCGWTAGGALVWALFLGCLGLARESVWRDGPDLCVRWHVVGLGPTWRYAVAAMGPLSAPTLQHRPPSALGGASLVVVPDEGALRPTEADGASGGPFRTGVQSQGVRFHYAGNDVGVGVGLDEGQAARLAEVMALRFGLRLGTGPSGV